MPGQRYIRADGAEVRVDQVKGGDVYCCSWLPGQTHGTLSRMTEELFRAAIEREGMVLK
jgi:hypothetical protein